MSWLFNIPGITKYLQFCKSKPMAVLLPCLILFPVSHLEKFAPSLKISSKFDTKMLIRSKKRSQSAASKETLVFTGSEKSNWIFNVLIRIIPEQPMLST